MILAALCGAVVVCAPARAAFTTPLPIPQTLTGSDIQIPIVEADLQILPGAATRMWTYGGTFPGPTIRRPAGSETQVTFVNQLPPEAGDLTIHNHGAHVASSHDGQPNQLAGEDVLIPSGGQRTYTYSLQEDGHAERPAFQWYHDHRLDLTGRNVWNGLAGMFIIDDPVNALGLPTGDQDIPLMVVDREFDAVTNQLAYPDPVPFGTGGETFPGTGVPPNDAFTGTKLLVNGAITPYLDVKPWRYRLRLLNASNGRLMTFSLSNGQAMQQIATESGLLPTRVDRSAIELGSAERAEVVVDFAALAGQNVVLKTNVGDLVQFRVAASAGADPSSAVPADLSPAPNLGASVRERLFSLRLAEDPQRGRTAWTINGKTFDGTRTDASPKIGTTETWRFTGGTLPHVVHIHETDFRVLSRDGVPPPAWERGLKETVVVRPSETVVVQVRFTDNLGRYIFHCHVLEHEDNGMMARFDVSLTGDPEPTPPPTGDGSPAPSPGGPSPVPTVVAPTAANLALTWARPPAKVRPGGRLRLKLRVANDGGLASTADRVVVKAPGGVHVKGAKKGLASLTIPALAPGAARTFTLTAKAGRRLRAGALVAHRVGAGDARAADDIATVRYRRSGRALRRSARASSAAVPPGLLCRLGGG